MYNKVNMKKSLIIGGFLIFLISVLLVYIAMSNCGLNQFFVSLGCNVSTNSCGGISLTHISMMRSLLSFGLISAVVTFILFLFRNRILSLLEFVFERELKRCKSLAYNNKNRLGRLKPFDSLLMAYSAGVIEPKTFC